MEMNVNDRKRKEHLVGTNQGDSFSLPWQYLKTAQEKISEQLASRLTRNMSI